MIVDGQVLSGRAVTNFDGSVHISDKSVKDKINSSFLGSEIRRVEDISHDNPGGS